MSMIGSLIDELNKSADEWNGSNMFELARMCRNAADTIWQLRDDLQQTNAENARLREQIDAAHMSRLLTENENESLRELLQRLLAEYRYLRVRPRKMYLQHEARMRAIEKEMRELGVEVEQ